MKTSGSNSFGFPTNADVLFSFTRDVDSEDEFFLIITDKTRDEPFRIRIAVQDIDGMEHCEGSLKFLLHYQRLKDTSGPGLFKGKLIKKVLTMGKKSEDKYETITETFESKFVARIIECFNAVLTIMENEENELNDFVDYKDEPTKIVPAVAEEQKMEVVEDYLPP